MADENTGAEATTPTDAATTETTTDKPDETSSTVEDVSGLKSALDTERSQRKTMEKELKALRAEQEKAKQASMSEAEKAVAAARAEGSAEAAKKYGVRLAASELKSAAQSKGVDLSKVSKYIDAKQFVDDEGEVDVKAIKAAVADFAELVPKTGANQSGGDFGGGPNQPPASLDVQIAEAQKAGDYRRVIALQNQKLANTGE